MANWYGTARSNYFHVKDADAFTKEVGDLFPDIRVADGCDRDPDGSVCLLDQSGEGWPSGCEEFADDGEGRCANCDKIHAAESPASISELVAKHLVDDDVAIFIEIGAEKLRYLTGVAVAVNNAGGRVDLDLNEIYGLAAKLGSTITRAER